MIDNGNKDTTPCISKSDNKLYLNIQCAFAGYYPLPAYNYCIALRLTNLLSRLDKSTKMCRITIHIVTCKRCRGQYGSYQDSITECRAVGTSFCRIRIQRRRVAGDEYCSRECEDTAKRERQIRRDRRRGFPSNMRTGSDRYGRY